MHLPEKIIGDYTLTKTKLGEGMFGKVFLAKNNKTDKWLACKITKKQGLKPNTKNHLKNEIGILSRINHQNVISLFNIEKTENHFYLLMQFCNGGDLDKLRRLRGRFTEAEARFLMAQIMQGFKALH